jgi:hypothetical protein
MQAFANPVEKGASYPTEGQGGYGKKATYPLARNVLGLRLTVLVPEQPVDTIAPWLRRLPIDSSPNERRNATDVRS